MSDQLSNFQKFNKNKTAFVGLLLLVIFSFISLSAYLFLPDPSTDANHQMAEFARLSPGTKILYISKPNPEPPSFFWFLIGKKSELRIPLENKSLVFKQDTLFYEKKFAGKSWLLVPEFLFEIDKNSEFSKNCVAQTGKNYQISDLDIQFQNKQGKIEKHSLESIQNKVQAEEFTYWMGSDMYGRDIFSRLMLGTRASLFIGFFSMVFSLCLGLMAGLWAGWANPWAEKTIIWLMTVIWSVPTLLLAIAVAFVLGKGFFSLIVAIGLTSWVDIARMVKTEVQKIKSQLFIEAAFSMGFQDFRILFIHIFPNLIPILLILSCANFASAILLEAGLSFLGLGIPAPTPTWGAMVYEGYSYIVMENGKWLAIFPGMAIILLVLSLYWVANGLRDLWDR